MSFSYLLLAMESRSSEASKAKSSPPIKKQKMSDEVPSTSKQHKPKGSDVRPSVENGSISEIKTSAPRNLSEKYQQAQPYSFFLTKVSGIDDKYNSSHAMDIKGTIITMYYAVLSFKNPYKDGF